MNKPGIGQARRLLLAALLATLCSVASACRTGSGPPPEGAAESPSIGEGVARGDTPTPTVSMLLPGRILPLPTQTPLSLEPDCLGLEGVGGPEAEPVPDRVGGYVGTGLDPASCTWTTGSLPVQGVTVTLHYAGSDGVFGTGDPPSETTSTNEFGCYWFAVTTTGLARVSVPDALGSATLECSSGTALAGPIGITLAAGASQWDKNFGYVGQ